jgi:SPRY domain
MFASKDLFFTRPSGYQISRSVRLRSSASAYFNRTFTTPTDGKKYTFSIWAKRGAFGAIRPLIGVYPSSGATDSTVQIFEFSAADILQFTGQTTTWRATTAVYRDPSAWYHIVLVYDSTQATAANRELLYVNGVQVTAFTTSNDVALNTVSPLNANGAVVHIGSEGVAGAAVSRFYDGYLTEINFIDGQALTPSSFGQTNSVTGVWQPIKYTGTYGTNGFYLNFSDNSNNTATTIGKDYSGNGNNWTPNNISVTAGVTYDSMLDVPTPYADGGNGRGNYAVLNPLDVGGGGTFSDGNLKLVTPVSNYGTSRASFSVSSGKWYWEVTMTTAGSGDPMIGIVLSSEILTNWVGNTSTSYSYNQSTGKKYNNGTGVTYGASYTNGDVIGVALDLDSGTITFYKNNTSQGTAYTGLSGTFAPAISDSTSSYSSTFTVNFGQQGFTYTPPTGYVALNTQNLPTPTISNGANYMAATLWTGNGTSQTINNTVNGISFKPDMMWVKDRSSARSHVLIDSVRGIGLSLFPNETTADQSNTDRITSINTNGFSVGVGLATNANAETFVGWQWQAGQGSTSSNTNGSITSTVSVNATAGFSVVTYTGTGANATVGHGLGVAPKMIIVKTRSGVNDWSVYHTSIGATKFLLLDTTAAAGTSSAVWNNTAPTSSVFSIATDFSVNQSTATYVAYCFSAVAGYSAFGSYTGNGSTDGPFVYCGFRPRYVLTKCSSLGSLWAIWDTSRNTYNATSNVLQANVADAEISPYNIDILSNGFKFRDTNSNWNGSSNTYIFAAFAENPYKLSLAR